MEKTFGTAECTTCHKQRVVRNGKLMRHSGDKGICEGQEFKGFSQVKGMGEAKKKP